MPAEQMHGQAEYNPNSSSSASRMEGEHWLAEYIDGGYVGGDVFLDTVMVGGLAVEAQGVQVADLAHHEITDKPAMDGILGLGFDELNFARPTRLRTWFSNVAKGLQEPVFTVDFRQRDGEFGFFLFCASSTALFGHPQMRALAESNATDYPGKESGKKGARGA
jgi:hypothetical protein